MADTQPFKSELLYDSVSVFPLGMNSGREPQSIPKDQLASAINCTVRFDFLTNRPPYTNQLTILWPSTAVQQAVEQGLFQGAGYYQPDSGNASLFASISGRLFQFTLNGNTVTVTEQTIPGDPNPASSTQAWIWQAENFLIVNDGISLPLFFDGVSTRRSYGPSVLLATATTSTFPAAFAIPAIGSIVTLTLTGNWPGPYNVPVLFHGEYYQPVSNAGYVVNLTSLFSNAGEAIGVNEVVSIIPSIAGVIANPLALPSGAPFNFPNTLIVTFTAPYTGVFNPSFAGTAGKVILFGKVWAAIAATGNDVEFQAGEPGVFPATLASGTEIQYSSSIAPSVNVGAVTIAAVSPGIFGTVQVTLDQAFNGTPGQIVYLGTGQYTIVAIPPTTTPNTINLVNLTDASAGPYSFTNPLPILSVPELPAGRMGCYGLGQNWVCLVDGLTFIVSDESRGPSGTQANNWRDSVLKTTDLTFRGGNFAIPGAGNVISSMTFTANLDVTLGQGSLEVGTAGFIASCLAPIDFTNPPTTPVLTYSLVGSGPLAQNSTVRVNSDIFFRSVAGLGSLIRARRDFQTPGNSPISNEVMTFLDLDDKPLLPYGSSTVFNNRFLTTLSPQASSQGVLHAGLIALNLDPVSGMHDKQPPVYDGVWTGINALQLVTGTFSGTERCFAYTFNVALSKIELYELLPSDDNNFDNGVVPIVWTFETAMLFNKDVKRPDVMCSLRDGEFAVSDVTGNVRFEVYYKSDQGCWTPWHAFSICADPTGEPQYFPRLGLGEPDSKLCDPILNYPLRDGYMFQFRFVITGHCHFLRARFAAVTLPTPKFEPPICDVFATVTN